MTNRDLPVGENSCGFFAFGGGVVRKNADDICENLSSREDYTCGRKDHACGRKDYTHGREDRACGRKDYAHGREDRACGHKDYVCGREGFSCKCEGFTDGGARSAEGHDGKARRGGGLR